MLCLYKQYYLFAMLPLFFFTALILQSSLIFANPEKKEEDIVSRDVLKNQLEVDPEVKEYFGKEDKNWMDMFTVPTSSLYPSSAVTMMSQAANSEKGYEEQLKEIKEVASKIADSIKNEMFNVLDFAMTCHKLNDKNETEPGKKTKRSIETPTDSSQLVFRLLKHIKSNNEYQNIAIEKMMTAQEIADKYGIPFDPDVEILSDLAVAANEQAKEMTNILKDAVEINNATKKDKIEFVPVEEHKTNPNENETYYVYSLHHENPFAPYEYAPQPIQPQPHHQHHDNHNHCNHYETQIPAPQHHCAPVTPKSNFYDSMMAFTPAPEVYSYCFEPMTTTTTIVLPVNEIIEPEPELVGEEYEETVSSKMIVDHDDEPGSATVNHVMTYTLSEKAHFKTPQIEQLPQQMQYTFFLI